MSRFLAKGVPAAIFLALPLSASAATFKQLVDQSLVPLGDTVVALLYAIAFVAFLIGVFRYFLASQNEEGRQKGKQLMLWGVIALAVLFAVWGIVKLLLATLTSWA